MNQNILDTYIDFLICSTSYTTATALSRATGNAISHDQITRFLSAEDFTSQDLWQYAKPLIRSVQTEEDDDGVLVIDDSIEEKPYTDENDLIAWHYDHCKGRNLKGINFVSALYQTSKGAVPVAYELVRKTELMVNKKTGKKSRKSPVTKQQYFRNLIKVSIDNKVNFKTVLADIWFASAENMCYIKNVMHKDFIMPLKDNRKVALSEEKLAADEFVSIKELELGVSVLIRLKDVNFPLRLVRQVFKNEDGSIGVRYLASSDIELTDEQIKTTYHRRWRVEEYHKSLKNNASLAKSPTKTIRTQANHFFASICAFMRLEAISITTKLNHFSLKNKIYIEALKASFSELEKIKHQFLQTDKMDRTPA